MKKLYDAGTSILVVLLLGTAFLHLNLKEHNFGVVERDKIYRSARPDKEFLEKMKTEHGLKTIVVVGGGIKNFEKEWAEKNNVAIYHLPLAVREAPPQETMGEFLGIVQDKTLYPMLIHCKAGADRTGLMIAAKRIVLDGWTLEQARKEMVHYRHIPLFHLPFHKYLNKLYESITKNPEQSGFCFCLKIKNFRSVCGATSLCAPNFLRKFFNLNPAVNYPRCSNSS